MFLRMYWNLLVALLVVLAAGGLASVRLQPRNRLPMMGRTTYERLSTNATVECR